jgi:hypothetical protein
MALNGWLSTFTQDEDCPLYNPEALSSAVYKVADAMIAEREKNLRMANKWDCRVRGCWLAVRRGDDTNYQT